MPSQVTQMNGKDTDGDGTGDNSDEDIDNDGVRNDDDIAPYDKQPLAQTNQNVYIASIGDEIELDASPSVDEDGNIVSYFWDFGEEQEEGRKVKVAFNDPGVYLASMTVTDDAGQSHTTEFKVRVFNPAFILGSFVFILFLILLAFYLIYRYTRRASEANLPRKQRKRWFLLLLNTVRKRKNLRLKKPRKKVLKHLKRRTNENCTPS